MYGPSNKAIAMLVSLLKPTRSSHQFSHHSHNLNLISLLCHKTKQPSFAIGSQCSRLHLIPTHHHPPRRRAPSPNPSSHTIVVLGLVSERERKRKRLSWKKNVKIIKNENEKLRDGVRGATGSGCSGSG